MIDYNKMPTEEDVAIFRERGYVNDDLLPQTQNDRTMTALNYFTLWMGSIHNIPNYAAVAGFLLLGLSPINVLIAVSLSGLAIAIFMVLNGRAGAKYGIPFALHLRATYGQQGAKLPGFLRGCVAAIAWFGVQTYTGAAALTIILGRIWPAYLQIGGGANFFGLPIPDLISFIVFWMANMFVGLGGGKILNKFTAILSPIIYLVFGGMTIWALRVGGGLSAIFSYHMGAASDMNVLYGYLLIIASMIAVWAAPGVSVADFTQNARSQEDQAKGQIGSLFLGHTIFAIMAVIIVIGGTIHYGPPTSGEGVLDFIKQWDNTPAIILASLVFLMTTISTNATGNIIPAGYQLAALFPDKIDYRKGVWIAGIISVIIMPWKFMAGGEAIIKFLNAIGALLGPVAGVMIAHYYIISHQKIDLNQLYFDPHLGEKASLYSGINVTAYIATLIGFALSFIGHFVPALAPLSDMAWLVGFFSAFISYIIISKLSKNADMKTIESL